MAKFTPAHNTMPGGIDTNTEAVAVAALRYVKATVCSAKMGVHFQMQMHVWLIGTNLDASPSKQMHIKIAS